MQERASFHTFVTPPSIRRRQRSSHHPQVFALVAFLTILSTACGGGDQGGDSAAADDHDTEIVRDDDPISPEHDTDTDPSFDTDSSSDIKACPGGQGCACTQADDCDSGYCFETADGRVCSSSCDDSCPTGFLCRNIPGADATSVCVAAAPRLCSPCEKNADCHSAGVTDARCVPHATGAYCGVACSADSDCAKGYACKSTTDVDKAPTKQCLPVDSAGAPSACSCTANAVALGFSTACLSEQVSAGKTLTCAGVARCKEAGKPASCTAPKPTDESCDGLDNDCDGETDEVTCDDDNPCTTDLCQVASGDGKGGGKAGGKGCVHKPLADGISCDADGSVCTVADACVAGVCTAGKAKVCDDGNPCTLNGCDPKQGCTKKNDDNSPCDDSNPCTVGDSCAAGSCVSGLPKACTSTNACEVVSCNGKTGACDTAPKPAGTPCTDDNPCTEKDGCDNGSCAGSNKSCDDGNPCTDDSCNPKKAGDSCVHLPNSATCSDRNLGQV